MCWQTGIEESSLELLIVIGDTHGELDPLDGRLRGDIHLASLFTPGGKDSSNGSNCIWPRKREGSTPILGYFFLEAQLFQKNMRGLLLDSWQK